LFAIKHIKNCAEIELKKQTKLPKKNSFFATCGGKIKKPKFRELARVLG
jgi:hypothetical protein